MSIVNGIALIIVTILLFPYSLNAWYLEWFLWMLVFVAGVANIVHHFFHPFGTNHQRKLIKRIKRLEYRIHELDKTVRNKLQ